MLVPPSTLSMPELESELVGLAGHLAAAHCRWLLLLAEFDARDGWGGPGLRSCAHWLSWRVGMSLRTAMEQVRVAHALTALPALTAAFAAGRVSYSKVRAITRVATADTEETLLELALAGTTSHVERVVRMTRQAQADPADVHARRGLDWEWHDDGTLRLRATLTAEQGAALLAALSAITDAPAPQRSAEQCEPDVPVDPLAARRADALVELATGAHTATAQVVLHLDADQATAELEHGPAVPLATAERVGCHARVRALLKDRAGNPLYLGRTRRLVSKTLLAVIGVRDQHQCRFPGCHETRYLDAHHIQHWLRGGPTDVENLALLCDRHHRLVHDHGYQMRGRGNDVTFHRPDGQLIPTSGPPTEGTLDDLLAGHARHHLTIADDTITPTWAGDRLDPTPILQLLLPELPAAAA